jgi:SAM-dependent methyltransferase
MVDLAALAVAPSMTSDARDWNFFARKDPFFAVLTDQRYRGSRLAPEVEKEFWLSGEKYVQDVQRLIQHHFHHELRPERALDFGCGVGRLLIPIARISGEATGVDISTAMLSLADAACRNQAVSNVRLISAIPSGESFDFVDSALVFQHIPVREGLRLLSLLLGSVRRHGFAAIQFLYARSPSYIHRRAGRWIRSRLSFANVVANLLEGRAATAPYLQMNAYPLVQVIEIFRLAGFERTLVMTDDDGGFRSVRLLGQRVSETVPEPAANPAWP